MRVENEYELEIPVKKSMSMGEEFYDKDYSEDKLTNLPGKEIVLKHKLSPTIMRLTIYENDNKSLARHVNDYMFDFKYVYLDLPFSIKTDDVNIVYELCPYFSSKQKEQLSRFIKNE